MGLSSYFSNFPQGDVLSAQPTEYSREYSVGCAESTSPWGKFEKYEDNPILKYEKGEFSGPGHNCFFEGKDGKLYTAFHIHTDYDKPSGDRRACIAEVYFDEAGKMRFRL